MRAVRPSGFLGGLGLGIVLSLLVLGDLVRLMSLVAPVWAQSASAPAVRIMDGTHTQLALVDHAGALSVSLSGSGATNIGHIQSVTHISGRVMLQNVAGTVVTVSGTALNVDLASVGGTILSGANVVDTTNTAFRVSQSLANWTVAHVSAQLHVANTTVLSALAVRCVNTGATAFESCGGSGSGDAVNVFHQSTVRHISSVTHVAGGIFLTNQAGTVVTVTGTALDVNCTGCSAASVVAVTHISGAVHVVNSFGQALHVQGLGVPGASHGGVLTIQGITGMNPVSVAQGVAPWTLAHVTSVTHIRGGVFLTSQAGTAITSTSNALDVNCASGCSSGGTISHITSAVHVVGYAGAALHVQGIGLPGAAHGGVVSIQGVGGMVAVSVAQSVAAWTLAHVTSVTHVVGTVSLVSRAGAYATYTAGALDVNCASGCSSGGTVSHVTSVTHVYGSVSLIARDGTYAGFAGTSLLVAASSAQSGAWTIQAAHQGGEWNVRHVSAVVHVSVVSSGHLTGAIHVAGLSNIGSGAPGTSTTQMVCHSTLAVHVAAAAPGLTQIIHLTSTNNNTDQTSWRIYICGIVLVSAHAQGFSLYEGTGTTCVTGKRPLMGSYRPDDSMILAGNGGFSAVAPFPWMSTQNPGNNVCIGQTTRASGGTISGVITYRAGP